MKKEENLNKNERELSKRVIIEFIDDSHERIICPTCKTSLVDETEHKYLDGCNYCPNCAQKLDWHPIY